MGTTADARVAADHTNVAGEPADDARQPAGDAREPDSKRYPLKGMPTQLAAVRH